MSDVEEELILKDLNDDDLVAQMQDDLYDGLKAEVFEGTQILLDRGWDANMILNDALVEGMRIVGVDFRDGILFVPEVLQCADAMKGGMGLLRPILANSEVNTSIGKYVIGTVKGDIHDIGKNLVGMMLEGAGFEVIDLGINNPVDNYLAAIDEHEPVIMGMSALLTTTMPYMGVVIEEFDKRGLLKELPIMVGGAPLNQEFADAINAHTYGRDAAMSAELAKAIIGKNR
jgi:methanogenic corrinoid protein MtbC1